MAVKALMAELPPEALSQSGVLPLMPGCNALLARSEAVNAALDRMQNALAEDHFASGLGCLREALCLTQGFTKLRESTAAVVIKSAQDLLPRNWRVADALLQEITGCLPEYQPDADFIEKLQRARREELIASALHQAEQVRFNGRAFECRKRLVELIALYPWDKRLTERLERLSRTAAPARPESNISKPPLSNSPSAVEAAPAGTGTNGYLASLAALKHTYVLFACSAMLGIVGFLIWQHVNQVSRPAVVSLRSSSLITASIVPADGHDSATASADEEVWHRVKSTNNAQLLRSFLKAYPASVHALRVQVKLASLDWSNLDKTNPQLLTSYIRLHPYSPHKAEAEHLVVTSDREAILKAVESFYGEPTATSCENPAVAGDRATVACSFDAGREVLFLEKHAGVWDVNGAGE